MPKPPPAPVVPVAQSQIDIDPYNLDSSGIGKLSQQAINGAYEFFNLPTKINTTAPRTYYDKNGKKKTNNAQVQVAPPPMTATQVITAFTHIGGAQLATIQDQLYRAGYYSSTYVPKYGILGVEDIAAFRSMMIGLAANPSQATLPNYLSQAVQAGDSTVRHRTPLVTRLTNPDDLRVTLQKTAQDLYGAFLPEDQVQKFISAFQGSQAASQTQAYEMGGFNPETGQSDLSGAKTAGGTVTAAASPGAAAESYVRQNFPNEVAATQFGNAMGSILDTLKRPA